MSDHAAISTPAAPAAIGPYSQAIRAGDLLFVSGQIPLDPSTGELVGGDDPAAQADQVMRNIEAVLAAGGAALSDVVKCTIYLTDLAAFGAVNQVYGRRWPAPMAPPARATVEVSALPKGVLVEIDAIARIATP